MFGPILILNSLRGLRRFYRRPLPQNTVRQEGSVTIVCPRCKALRSALVEVHQRSVKVVGTHTADTLRLFRCESCDTQYNADRCTNDGTGTWTVQPWPCALCQQINPPECAACQNCGAGGSDADV